MNSLSFSQLLSLFKLEVRRVQTLFLDLSLMVALFCGLALFNGSQFVARQQDNAQHLTQKYQDFVTQQELKTRKREASLRAKNKPLNPDTKIYRNPAWLAEEGPALIYPTHDLQLLSQGQLLQQPQAIELSWNPAALLKSLDNLQHPLQRWLGSFDWVFIWVYLWPLFVIALAYDLSASDRQAGSLRLSYVQSGQRLGPLNLRLVSRLGLALVPVLVLHGLVLFVLGPAVWQRWALMLAVVVLYTCFWLALCFYFNSLSFSAPQIAALLISLWLLFVWWIPASTQQSLQALYPLPEAQEFRQNLREVEELARKNNASLRSEYLDDHPEMQGQNNSYALRKLSHAELLQRELGPLIKSQNAQIQRRQAWQQWLVYLSPIPVVEQSLSHLAASDTQRFSAYQQQVADFQQSWLQFFKPLITQQRALSSSDFGRFPQFDFVEPQPRLRVFGGALLYLLLLSLGLLLVAYRREQNRPL